MKSWQSVSFSPDGTRIISGSDDNTICIWNAITGAQLLPPLLGHEDWVQSVTFTPSGTHIVSMSDDNIRVWDAMSGVQLSSMSEFDHALYTSNDISCHAIHIANNRWVMDWHTNNTICKLPVIVSPLCSAAYGRSLVIGTCDGHVIVIHFPSTVCNNMQN
jgi:WD40 repeat protein